LTKMGLGKGLGALIPIEAKEEEGEVREIELRQIKPGRGQSRKIFDEEKIDELAQSIKENGLLQPIIVRKIEDESFEIIAGERRWRACRVAGIERVSVIVKKYNDEEAAAASIIENIQRENLNPLEEAEAYDLLIKAYNYTQEEISRKVGKTRPFITNMLRLLSLQEEIKQMVKNESLTAGHARALLALKEEEDQKRIANEVVERNLSVRETEKLIRKFLKKDKRLIKEKIKSIDIELINDIEKKLIDIYKEDVKVIPLSKGNGKIIIKFKDKEKLKQVLELLLR